MANSTLLNRIGIAYNIGNNDINYQLLINQLNAAVEQVEVIFITYVDKYNTLIQRLYPDMYEQYKLMPIDSTDSVYTDSVWTAAQYQTSSTIEDLTYRVEQLERKIYGFLQPVHFACYVGTSTDLAGQQAKTYTNLKSTSELISVALSLGADNPSSPKNYTIKVTSA